MSRRVLRTAKRLAVALRLTQRPLRWAYPSVALSALALILDSTVGPTWPIPAAGFHASSMADGAAITCLAVAVWHGLLFEWRKGGRR